MADERDAQVGQNLARHRGIRSQQSLAVQMRDRGWKWSQATVWSVEKGERPLKFLEAVDLAEILEIHPWDLLQEANVAAVTRAVADRTRSVKAWAERAGDALVHLEQERRALAEALDVAATVPDWDRLANAEEIARALSYSGAFLAEFADATVNRRLEGLFASGHPDRLDQFVDTDEVAFSPAEWRAERGIELEHEPPGHDTAGGDHGLDQETSER